MVVFAEISEEERELILWKNAARIFKLEEILPILCLYM